jgi:hypothetical protein
VGLFSSVDAPDEVVKMKERMADLDELVLSCRDLKAREYVAEAVACYRAGAFRSCIVSTWLAVSFDFFDKIAELAILGDKEAELLHTQFRNLKQNNDIYGFLKFERQIPTQCVKLQMLSPVEEIDIDRLLKDRDRCAHPSINVFDEPFRPTAEQARTHLRNSIEHMLSQPSVKGKAAMKALVKHVSTSFFPEDRERIIAYLEQSPLVRPRPALVKDFVYFLLEQLFVKSNEPTSMRIINILDAVITMHREVTEKALNSILEKLLGKVPPERFGKVVMLLGRIPVVWDYVPAGRRAQIEEYVRKMPEDDILPVLPSALEFAPLADVALVKAKDTGAYELGELISSLPTPIGRKLLDIAVEDLRGAWNFKHINNLVKSCFHRAKSLFTVNDLEKIIKIASNNNGVAGAWDLQSFVDDFPSFTNVTAQQRDELLEQYDAKEKLRSNLSKYSSPSHDISSTEDDK